MKNYIIYKHTSPSGKIYIGQTCKTNPKRRWANGKGYKSNPYFYNAISKYGWSNFTHEIICSDLQKWEADWTEKYLIAFYNTTNPQYGYNLTCGGEGTSGFHHSEETKQKIGDANRGNSACAVNKGKHLSEETRKKLSVIKKGKKLSPETKAKLSEAHKGNKNMLGKHHSEETKQKLSEHFKGCTSWNKGIPCREETKRKLSERNKGLHRVYDENGKYHYEK